MGPLPFSGGGETAQRLEHRVPRSDDPTRNPGAPGVSPAGRCPASGGAAAALGWLRWRRGGGPERGPAQDWRAFGSRAGSRFVGCV